MRPPCHIARQTLLCLFIFLVSAFMAAGCTTATSYHYQPLASNSEVLADAGASQSILAALDAKEPPEEDHVLIIGRFTLLESGKELPVAQHVFGFRMAGTWTDHHLGWGDESAEHSIRTNADGFFAFSEPKEWVQSAQRWPRIDFTSMSWLRSSADPYAEPLRKRLATFTGPVLGPYRIVRVRDGLYCIEPNVLYRPTVLVRTIPDLKPAKRRPVAESWGFASAIASP